RVGREGRCAACGLERSRRVGRKSEWSWRRNMRERPVTRREFQKLADLRVQEAFVLVQNRRPQGAYYLAGYAVECALKACIAKETKRHEFPPKRKYVQEVYTHILTSLLQ